MDTKTFKAILFDLDGTLLNTVEDIGDAMNAALSQMGYTGHPTESYKYFVGDGAKNLVIRALPEGESDEETVSETLELWRREYDQGWARKSRPYEGIPDMLSLLQVTGIPMAILSNKPDEFTTLCVQTLLPKWDFAYIRGKRSGVPLKPDPTSAIQLAEDLDCNPSKVLYLGDTATDMETATAAGFYAVGAEWGFRGREELLEAGASVTVETPRQVVEMVLKDILASDRQK